MFHIKSNLPYLVCQCVISVLFVMFLNMMCGVRAVWLVGRSNSNFANGCISSELHLNAVKAVILFNNYINAVQSLIICKSLIWGSINQRLCQSCWNFKKLLFFPICIISRAHRKSERELNYQTASMSHVCTFRNEWKERE